MAEFQGLSPGRDAQAAAAKGFSSALRHLPAAEAPPSGVLEAYKERFRSLSASPAGPEKP
jgi:hypothetical protein